MVIRVVSVAPLGCGLSNADEIAASREYAILNGRMPFREMAKSELREFDMAGSATFD